MKKNQNQITIVLPVYNNVHTIERTVESVISQVEFNSVDFLVIDNNSNDGTSELLKSYEDKLRLIRYNETVDMASNWQRCIDQSNSEYITMIHADDWYEPGTIRAILSSLQSDPVTDLFIFKRRIYKHGKYAYQICYNQGVTLADLAYKFPGISYVVKKDRINIDYNSYFFPIFDYVWFVKNLGNMNSVSVINNAAINIYTGDRQVTNQVKWTRSILKALFCLLVSKDLSYLVRKRAIRHLLEKLYNNIVVA